MGMMQATLNKKIKLTSDVYELHYGINDFNNFIPWQFITFLLPEIGWRAYSVLEIRDWSVVLIIKRWKKEDGGRWGSIALCDSKIWDEFKCVWPTWHFTLSQWNSNRCFLWTGTGFVPLYNQFMASLNRGDSNKIKFIFWVKTQDDLFYIEELEKLQNQYNNFSYIIYLSRETANIYEKWYVTDYLTQENIAPYNEFYICWAPAMIEDSIKCLEAYWVEEQNVFFEKYT